MRCRIRPKHRRPSAVKDDGHDDNATPIPITPARKRAPTPAREPKTGGVNWLIGKVRSDDDRDQLLVHVALQEVSHERQHDRREQPGEADCQAGEGAGGLVYR
jgi:hypothetical protein